MNKIAYRNVGFFNVFLLHNIYNSIYFNKSNGGLIMNLIEQLGGYEKAKVFINATSYTVDELLMMQRSGLRSKHVEEALLQYRREHGIFEVGDWVVSTLKHDSWWKSKVMKIKHIHKNIFICESVHGDVHQYDVRHATNEEIKSGRKL